jgi:Alpha-kinase family
MMIVDLQGVGNVLTDPQIHCLDKSRFGKGNLGYQGILMFFNTHQCNDHCRSLGLLNPRETNAVSASFRLITNPEESSDAKHASTSVHKLCDLCRKPFLTTFGHYVSQRNQCYELWCDPCT